MGNCNYIRPVVFGTAIDYKITLDKDSDHKYCKNFIESNKDSIIKLINNNVVVFHIKDQLDSFYLDFIQKNLDIKYKLCKINLESKNLYCFENSIKFFPHIKDNKSVTSNVYIFFKYKGYIYNLRIKDKYKKYYSNVGGCAMENEIPYDCIKREIEEEIELKFKESFMTFIDKKKNKKTIPVFECKIKNECYVYYLSLMEKELKNWKYFKLFEPHLNKKYHYIYVQNDEIEIIKITKLFKEGIISDQDIIKMI
jgi:8-oxo-dGTP pyrophosphatase MutT (NUDIX family)